MIGNVGTSGEEIVGQIIAGKNYPKFSQYLTTVCGNDFRWIPETGLIYFGPRERALEIIVPYESALIEKVRATVSQDEIEIFSTENLWDLDAFELGEIACVEGNYYNMNALYEYFNKQFSIHDPFYYEVDLQNYGSQQSIIATSKSTIELPANRIKYSLAQLNDDMNNTSKWWLPIKLRTFGITLKEPSYTLPPFVNIQSTGYDTDESSSTNYDYWVDYDDEDVGSQADTEDTDPESREIDYPYEDPDSYSNYEIDSDYDYY